MSWYKTEGKDPHHTLRSEAQYIRNIASLPFSEKADNSKEQAVLKELETLLEANGFKKEPFPKGILHQLSYVEKGFLDADAFSSQKSGTLLYNEGCRLYFNEPCSLAVSIGGRDLLTIRSLLPGRAVKEAQSIAVEAEELFDKHFEFAYSPHFGYLSPTLSRCGSGLTLSALLFLPAITGAGEINKLIRSSYGFGASLAPMFNYQNNSGDLYLLTHSPHHLSDQRSAAAGFDSLITKIIEKEKQYESIIFAEGSKIIIDKAYRAIGALMYAVRMDEREMLSHLSSIRLLCTLSSERNEAPPVPLQNVNQIFAECLNASIASAYPEISCDEEVDEKRAVRIKSLLNERKAAPSSPPPAVKKA